ncbi:MAG: SPOR domain-containing protein [Sulfurisoma sp.]|nr:SPOR domain-containing protein [Sulfurisoma sp.]
MGLSRAAFLLLVFANLAFFAWAQGYFGGSNPGREPQRLANQLAADNLRIVSTTPAGGKGDTATKPAEGACRLVTGLPPGDVDAFKAALAGQASSVDIKPVEESSSYWVHIPPQANKAAAEKKAGELKGLGVKDFYIVPDEGATRYAISLGLFKSNDAANEFLRVLGARGVKSARIDVREAAPQPVRAIVKGSAEILNKRLPDLLAKLPGAAAVECP